jgi:5-methylcytosine-specific restriction endonuclease McrA
MTQEQKSKQKVAVSLANKGKERTKESREKLSNSISGDKHWNWKGGVTPIHAQLRNNLDIKEWRRKVFEKDNYTCGICEVRGGYLQAHHILPFSIFPQFRLNVENGITLHKECHLKIKNKEFLYAPIFLGV